MDKRYPVFCKTRKVIRYRVSNIGLEIRTIPIFNDTGPDLHTHPDPALGSQNSILRLVREENKIGRLREIPYRIMLE